MNEEMDHTWQALSEEVLTGMKEWRIAHPKATLREIEQAVEERVNRLKARVLQDAALASAASDARAGHRAAAARVSRVWDTAASAGHTHAEASCHRRAGHHPRTHIWNLPDLWGRAFPPSMRNWL